MTATVFPTPIGLHADPIEHERRQEVVARTESVIGAVIGPALEALDDAESYLKITAAMDASPGDAPDPQAAAYDLAVAERERELVEHLQGLVSAIRGGVADLRRKAEQPLAIKSPADQFRFWLREIRAGAYGRRRIAFTTARSVEISEEYVLERREFLTTLFIEFVQQWEAANAALLERQGATPEQIATVGRITAVPSWRQLQDIPELPLSDDETLTVVGAGVVLGLWEAFPAIEQLGQYASELDEEDMPFIHPGPALRGAADPR